MHHNPIYLKETIQDSNILDCNTAVFQSEIRELEVQVRKVLSLNILPPSSGVFWFKRYHHGFASLQKLTAAVKIL